MRSLALVAVWAAALASGASLLGAGCGGDGGGSGSPDGGGGGADAAAPPCSGESGTFHNQTLEVGGERRAYFLYVPAAYDCAAAWPLLVDFHGTGGGAEPEILYKNPELLALADAEGFLVVRPRSRSSKEGGTDEIYRWDENPGDLGRNVDFAHALVADLEGRYHIDPARVYASGFSSGSNMAAQFLADDPAVFKGLGLVAGGAWTAPVVGADPPARIYATTGYRDYLWYAAAGTRDLLAGAGYPMDHFFLRESDMGHELYGWHFAELWAWLDRGERPPPGSLASGWTRDAGFTWTSSLTELARAGDGGVVAAAADGTLYRREPDSDDWARTGSLAGAPALAGLCMNGAGGGVAVGSQKMAITDDGGATWTAATPPPGLDPAGLDPAALNAVSCGDGGMVVAGGYWAALTSENGGASWTAGSMTASYGFSSQVAAVARSDGGTYLAAGYYDYVGVSSDGVTFEPVTTPETHEWWTAAAAHGGGWTVVGEGGAVLLSTDDGMAFTRVATPTDQDLYAVAFRDADTGLAVGAHGTALLTRDGGTTWTDASSGLDDYLGAVLFLGDGTALVAGGRGSVLRFTVP